MESDHLPLEMGVFEDFTTMSATSIIGIAFLLPRGGVGNVEGPGEGAENILKISMKSPLISDHSHPDSFSDTLQSTERTPLLQSFLLLHSRHLRPNLFHAFLTDRRTE